MNRGLPIPQPTPYVSLVAPSGTSWTWNDQQEGNSISGLAVDFCYVVTQVRNIADTGLNAIGENARRWMEYAQCFVGDPQDPPPSGTRYMLRM